MAELQFEAVEFDPYELDPSESPRWNLLARVWDELQVRLSECVWPVHSIAGEREEFDSLTYISRWFGTELVSPFLKQRIVTIDEYIDHCHQQAAAWHKADHKSTASANRSKAFFESKEKKRQERLSSSAVGDARQAWRDAIRRKKETMVQMDAEIRELHDRFVRLRDGLETPVVKS